MTTSIDLMVLDLHRAKDVALIKEVSATQNALDNCVLEDLPGMLLGFEILFNEYGLDCNLITLADVEAAERAYARLECAEEAAERQALAIVEPLAPVAFVRRWQSVHHTGVIRFCAGWFVILVCMAPSANPILPRWPLEQIIGIASGALFMAWGAWDAPRSLTRGQR